MYCIRVLRMDIQRISPRQSMEWDEKEKKKGVRADVPEFFELGRSVAAVGVSIRLPMYPGVDNSVTMMQAKRG